MDQYYLEEGYYELGYFQIIKESDVSLEPYYGPDYAETGYIDERGSLFDISINAGLLLETTSSISSSSSMNIDGDRIRSVNASITGAFTPSISVDIADDTGYYIPDYIQDGYYALPVQEASATLNSTASVDATVTRIQQFDASAGASFTTSAELTITRSVDVSLAINTTITPTPGRIQPGAVVLLGVFSPVLTANALKNHTAVLDSRFATNADAEKIASANITLDNLVNLSLQGDKTASFAATANSVAQLLATSGGLLLESISTQSVTARMLAIGRFEDERPYNGVNNGLVFITDKVFGSHAVQVLSVGAYATFTPRIKEDFLPHAPGFIQNNGEMAIDFWLRAGANDGVFLIDQPNEGPTSEILMTVNSSSVPVVNINGALTLTGVALGAGYEHFRILFEQTNTFTFNVALYQAGNRVATTSVSSWTPPSNPVLTIGDFYSIGAGARIDEFRILKSPTLFADQGWSLSDTTISVPTAPFANTDDTTLLLHFDNNLLDDTDTLREYSADLSANFTTTVGITGPQRAQAVVNATATLSADVNNTKIADANLNAQCALSAVANFTTNASASLSGTGGFNVLATALIPGDFFASAQATLSAQAERIQGIVSTLNTTATLQTDGLVIPGLHATLVAQADLEFGNRVIVLPEVEWLSRRSVFHWDGTSADLVSSVGVSGNLGNVFDATAGQTGFGAPISNSGASESSAALAYFNGEKYRTVERNSGRYNTVINNDDFIIDFYLKPWGDSTRYNTVIDLHNSANAFRFGYTYDESFFDGVNNLERFNFIIQENATDAYTFNYVVNTGTSEYFNEYYDPNPLQPNFSGWIYFRIQRINGNLTVRMRDIALTPTVSNIITANNYSANLGSGFTIFEDAAHTTPTAIDLFSLQIATAEYPLVTGAQPNIQTWHRGWLPGGGFLDTRSTLTTSSLKVLFGEINASANVTQTALVNRTRSYSVNASTTATLAVDAVKVAQTTVSMQTEFAQNVSAIKTATGTSTLSSTSTLSASGDRARLTSAQLSVSATVLAEPSIIRTDSASLSAQFASVAQNQRIRDNTIDTDAIASSLIVAAKVGDFFANADLQSTLNVTARKTTDTPIDLNVVAQGVFDPIKSVFAESSLDAQFAVSSEGLKIRAAESNQSSAFGIEITAQKITDTPVDIAVSLTLDAINERIRFNTVDLNTLVETSITGSRIRLGVVDVAVTSTVLATPFRVQRASADLSAFVFNITAGDIIHLDPFRTLIVLEESRLLKLLEEHRDLTVKQETRVLVV